MATPTPWPPAVIGVWSRLEYWPEQDPDLREAKKTLVMGGSSGVAWAATYDARPLDLSQPVGNMTLDEAVPIYSALRRLLEGYGSQTMCVVQIGSSSGREIAWLAEQFPDVRCIGTDIYPEVVEYSGKSHSLANLEFQVRGANDISQLLAELESDRLIVFSQRSLQYLQPEHVDSLFRTLSRFPAIEVLILEPASDRNGDPSLLEGPEERGNFSYTHDYGYYAKRNDFRTLECRVICPYDPSDTEHRFTVNYYWRGVPS